MVIMSSKRKIGIAVLVLGVIMFLVGTSMFTYQGEINPIVSRIGEFSFIGWFPTLIFGLILSKKK